MDFKRAIPSAIVTTLRQMVWLFVLISSPIFAQEPPRPEIDINAFIQELFPVPTDEANYEELYEALFQLYTNPRNLNTVTRDELAATYLLSQEQLNAFFDYRAKLGPLLSLYELQAIPGFDLPTIRRLLPFVIVQETGLPFRQSLQNPTQHFLMLRTERLLETQRGFTAVDTSSRSLTRYVGGPMQWYARYRYARTGAYSIGFTMEKDAGELVRWQPDRQVFGPDFTSFHAQIMNRGRLKNLIVGDFQMQAGQGMVVAAGFSLGKGAEVIRTTYRSTLGLRPYTSVLEAGFFRGIAATYALTRTIDFTAFYSGVRRDASLNPDNVLPGQLLVSSLQTAGLHRTPAEQARQGIIPEQNLGFHALYRAPSQRGQVGITALHTTFGADLQRRNVPYNRFEFTGKENLVVGIHGDYRWQNIHFFGEGARSTSGGVGGIGGLIAALGKTLDFTLLLRHYDRHFHTFYGNSFGEATRPINETGTYWGLRYSPSRRWQFSGFYDRFRFPWLKYLINAPSDGYDYFLHAQWMPNRRLRTYALLHEEHKQRNLPGSSEQPMRPLATTIRRTALINFEYEVPLKYSVRTRVQGGDFIYQGTSRSRGVTVLQDVTWRWRQLELSARVAVFSTDGYDSRQYVYEKDVLYAFSLPAYYNQGTRHYLMARYVLNKHLRVWLRWSQTRYSNIDVISSGLNEIQGSTRSDVKAQVMYQF
ncbi:ComEA family DNA-binding protein [Telluribacter humicola]|uniref:ComEA family DNA-binding protein n=1 Tax=Telluribacter humicola TaxID=1720261 RepID=UPI001E44A9D0|nr:helix-hairpin-helix domain-containing protein [Telluribacter humicola]